MLSLEGSNGLRAVGEPVLGRKSQCDSESTAGMGSVSGMASQLELPPSLLLARE